MIFDKSRFEIWGQTQHPYKHSLSDFAYTNPALPGVSDVNSALNWIMKVLYPNTKPAVANPAALPLIGNTINDYRVVLDDGDGKNAGYRWEQREGDVAPLWYKVFDFDWSTDSILAALYDITQDKFVIKEGRQDIDSSGNIIVGTYAGQRQFGGTQANQNLTLTPNSGDGAGAHTGFVQFDGHVQPTTTDIYNFGTNAKRFGDGFFNGVVRIGNLFLQTGQINDTGGAISFLANDLTTTGTIKGTNIYASAQLQVGAFAGNSLNLVQGSITDDSGAITFAAMNLDTTGTLAAGVTTVSADLVLALGSITSASGAISFGNEDLTTTGTLSAGNTTTTRLDADNIRLDGNILSILNLNGNLVVQANGTGVVDIQSPMTTLGQVVTGIVSITGQLNSDNLRLDANVISSTNLNGNITLTPNGSGVVETSAIFQPTADATLDLGTTTKRFKDLFLSGNIGDGTTVISQATIQSLRDINNAVGVGFTIFWNGTEWISSLPDTEIDHTTISGLLGGAAGDGGHSQFALLTGRVGGQTLQGGTAASNNLVFESTANASKGAILLKDKTTPFTNASFLVTWQGTDLGDSSHYFRDIYTKGELRGFRFENFTSGTLPAASVQNVGHSVWATDNNKIYVDIGGSWIVAGISKFISDTVWDGIITTLTVTTSSTITDARNALWQLMDNTNNFEIIFPKIEAISATQVRITASPALPAGSYRLIGVE